MDSFACYSGGGNRTMGLCSMLHGTGDRALGLQVAQLLEITRWIQARTTTTKIRLESTGMRNQLVALIAGALRPGLFSEVVIRDGIRSLNTLLESTRGIPNGSGNVLSGSIEGI